MNHAIAQHSKAVTLGRFANLGATTGRLSSAKPNIQGLPRRTREERITDSCGRVTWLYGMPRNEARQLAQAFRRAGFDTIAVESGLRLIRTRVRMMRLRERVDQRERAWEVRGKGTLGEAVLYAAILHARPIPNDRHRFSKRAWRRVLAGLQRVLADEQARGALEALERLDGQREAMAQVYHAELGRLSGAA